MQKWKCQRTGLTEGSLIYNEWLKQFGLHRPDTEDEFINWHYSSGGWYDKDIKGSYFDIDCEAVKRSENYQRFLTEFRDSLLNSDWFHLMLHSSWHLNGLERQDQFRHQFSVTNKNYWQDVPFLTDLVGNQKMLVISSIAPLITERYGVLGYQTPQTHFNDGPDKNSWETLDRVTAELPTDFDFALVSFGPYGCLLVDRLVRMGKSAATIGSGIYQLFPVGEIPKEYRPKNYKKIEGGRYWVKK
jgi:hypothetical protein